MRRPHSWFHWFLLIVLFLMLGEYLALIQVAPRHVVRTIERAAGGELAIGGARLMFPFTTRLTRLRLKTNTPTAAFTIQKAVIRPAWFSLPSKTLRIQSLEIHQPLLRLTRTHEGTTVWPALSDVAARGPSNAAWPWRLQIDSLKLIEGVVEFVDEQPSTTFHGTLEHLSLDVGPVSVPPSRARISFALSAELTGVAGEAAPLYCSGWLDLEVKDLQATCQLKPLALEAFEPYFHGRTEIRVYAATVQSTSQWQAQAGDFTGRIQLELGHLTEGDLSIHGRTIINVKHMTDRQEPKLSGELQLTGQLERPREWHTEFLPGDDHVQQLIKRLLDRGVELIRIPLWTGPLRVGLSPASRETMTSIEATAKEVEEALEILAVPSAEEEAPTTPTEPAPASEVAPAAAPEPVPASTPPDATPSAAPASTTPTAPTTDEAPTVNVTPPAPAAPTPPAPSSSPELPEVR